MHRWISTLLLVGTLAFVCHAARADDAAAVAVVDLAIQAMGGEAPLVKAAQCEYQGKGKIVLNNFEGEATVAVTLAGLERRRAEFDAEFSGNRFQGVTVLNGDKGWRKIADARDAMSAETIANEKRLVFMQLSMLTIVPLKKPGVQVSLAGDEQLNGKGATIVKVTGPDKKDFKIWFDRETHLPVKVAGQITDLQGGGVLQETFLSDYREAHGIKYASQVEIKRNGQLFTSYQLTSFQVLDRADPKRFEEP
jgi:hypothetical protein